VLRERDVPHSVFVPRHTTDYTKASSSAGGHSDVKETSTSAMGFKVTALATALLLSRCHASLLHFVGQVEVHFWSWVWGLHVGPVDDFGIGDFDPRDWRL
jgi:hypothetical protein